MIIREPTHNARVSFQRVSFQYRRVSVFCRLVGRFCRYNPDHAFSSARKIDEKGSRLVGQYKHFNVRYHALTGGVKVGRDLVEIITDQTVILLHNVKTTILTCDSDTVLCDAPIWKHLYHALHSCDQWFVNPDGEHTEPPFHEPGLHSLDVQSSVTLSRETLLDYYQHVRSNILDYLSVLEDDALCQKPEGCRHTRMALILGQFRHLYAHLGNINATTIIQTGRWPRVVGLDGDLSKGLYE